MYNLGILILDFYVSSWYLHTFMIITSAKDALHMHLLHPRLNIFNQGPSESKGRPTIFLLDLLDCKTQGVPVQAQSRPIGFAYV